MQNPTASTLRLQRALADVNERRGELLMLGASPPAGEPREILAGIVRVKQVAASLAAALGELEAATRAILGPPFTEEI